MEFTENIVEELINTFINECGYTKEDIIEGLTEELKLIGLVPKTEYESSSISYLHYMGVLIDVYHIEEGFLVEDIIEEVKRFLFNLDNIKKEIEILNLKREIEEKTLELAELEA